MDGNLCEIVLDVYTDSVTGSVNPTGVSSALSDKRVYCGGGWRFMAYVSSSGLLHGSDLPYSSRPYSCGFRLCLQGGELPELNGGTVLVNEAGEGTANWTPTKAGTYYLTHETQTNGVNGAEVLGAWFKVEGPELTFTPDGDLVPGVKIAIGDAGEGWTVRYEVSSGGQGAARPTGASPEYTGPITLNDSQTIRAIAFSDGGLESREFSATYSLMSIGSAVAKPRYPWNGKVDIDCEVKGDANRQYLISLEAIDLAGGTNRPVRTVVGRAVPSEPQSQANEFVFGYESGFIRVFELNEKKLKTEIKVFKSKSKIINMGFIQENHLLLILNDIGQISINNIKENYIVIKQLFTKEKIPKEISISRDQKKIAIYNRDNEENINNNLIIVYDSYSFDPIQRIIPQNLDIINIYLAHSNILCVIFKDSSIHFYSLIEKKGLLIKKLENIFTDIDSMYITNNYKYFFINSKKNGDIYILDSDCLFEEGNDNQKIKVTSEGYTSINFHESKSEITIAYRNIINVWKFGGDLIFSESKMLDEFIKLKNPDYVNEINKKSERNILIENTTQSHAFEKMDEIFDRRNKKKNNIESEINSNLDNNNELDNEENDNPNEEMIRIQEEIKKEQNENEQLKEAKFEIKNLNIFKERLLKNDIKDEKEEDSKEKRLKQKILMPPNLHYNPENIENLKE